MPIDCEKCGFTHNLHGDCVVQEFEVGGGEVREVHPSTGRNHPPETGKIPHFNALSIQHLPQKIDGETEHLFLAFLNDKAVGSCTARIWDDKSCGVRRMFVTPNERGKGIGTRLLTAIEILARQERATHLEISVNRGNVNARKFWIMRKFVDAPELEAKPDPIRFAVMVKPL